MAHTDQNLALLKNNLQMPLITRDLLLSDCTPAADATYALHEMLSDYSAEQAILCAVLTTQEITNFNNAISTDISFLKMECERLTERYTTRIDLEKENNDLWNETQRDMMPVIAEDIEGLLDILNLCSMTFEITNPKVSKILDILTIQLQSHLVIIDEIIERLNTQSRSMTLPPTKKVNGYQADNVIMFPH